MAHRLKKRALAHLCTPSLGILVVEYYFAQAWIRVKCGLAMLYLVLGKFQDLKWKNILFCLPMMARPRPALKIFFETLQRFKNIATDATTKSCVDRHDSSNHISDISIFDSNVEDERTFKLKVAAFKIMMTCSAVVKVFCPSLFLELRIQPSQNWDRTL